MRIGVTGASGFIGSHLTRALKEHGKVATLSRGKSLPLLAHLKSFVLGVDLFFHLGGVNRGTNEDILTGNITGTLRLLEAIKRYGEPSARILFASSAQVYRLKNRAEKISEKSALQPESIYGVSKKSAEDLIRISGLPYTILRMTNAYGPGCRADYNSVVTTFCYRTKNKIPLEISPLINQIFEDGQLKYGPREWSPNIIKRLEDATGISVLAPGFPDEIVDDEEPKEGYEVIPTGT